MLGRRVVNPMLGKKVVNNVLGRKKKKFKVKIKKLKSDVYSRNKNITFTDIKPTKHYWAIIRQGDPKGYHTGRQHMDIFLVESDDIVELGDYIQDGVVDAGESMGDYIFDVLKTHPEERTFYQALDASRRGGITKW